MHVCIQLQQNQQTTNKNVQQVPQQISQREDKDKSKIQKPELITLNQKCGPNHPSQITKNNNTRRKPSNLG